MTKKILLIVGILIIVGVALFLGLTSKPESEIGGDGVGFSIRDYLPFGSSDNTDIVDEDVAVDDVGTDTESPNTTQEQPVPRLRKISSEPVAGAVIFGTGATSTVRFVEKGTGNVYEVKSDSVVVSRLTNTTIPKIVRAFWLPNGNGFLAQTLEAESEVVETSYVKLNKNTASSTDESLTPFNTTIGKLPTGIKEISIKPDGSKIFYYTLGNVSNWFISNPDGTGSSLMISHPLTEWIPKWTSENTVVLHTKGSFKSVGFVYLFDVSSKILRKIGSGVVGLSANPNSTGSLSLVSGSNPFPQLSLVDTKNFSSKNFGINTLTEKCVWTKDKAPSVYCAIPNQIPTGNYPDVWYKGLVATEDFIEKIDLNNDIFHNVANLSDLSGQKIDVVDPSLSPDNTHMIFRNKIDGYLWMLRFAE